MMDLEPVTKKEMDKIIPTVGVVVFRKDSFLIVRHEPGAGGATGSFGLPAGRIEEGESEQVAAARELEEETGIKTQPENLLEFEGN